MTAGADGRTRLIPLLVAAALVVGVGLAASAATSPAFTRDRDFAVTLPADGSSVRNPFLLAWAPGARPAAGGYAVVIDAATPPPGGVVRAGPRTVLVRDSALQLTLGAATTGSPSARGVHVISVVRLDEQGRRDGEDVAVVHVRATGSGKPG